MRRTIPLTLAFGIGCSVSDRVTPIESDVPYACGREPMSGEVWRTDRDCSVGSCLNEFGVCAQASGEITTVLFEVTPQASDPVYGGARFLLRKNLATADLEGDEGRGIKPGWLELNVPPRVPVSGRITVDAAACIAPFPALTTLPATLVFTPRERLLGLGVESYEMSTDYDDDVHEFLFEGSLPPGDYDVYMRPETARLGEGCKAIPQIFRNQSIGGCRQPGSCGQEPFELKPPAPRPLRLTIPWQPNLEGWVVDMIHPVTGEIISNQVRLRSTDVVDGEIVALLNYSRSRPEEDFILDGDELVRLTPSEGPPAGTVLLQRSGLELLASGEAEIGDVSTFGAPVEYQAWVWKKGERDSPVPGVVSFAAVDLDEVAEGVLVSFSETAEVNERGQVNVQLLPGRYRVRVTPPALDDPTLGLLAGFESVQTVWPSLSDGPTTQAGHVIEVPPAVTLEGSIVTEYGNAPLRSLEVRASASSPEGNPCTNMADSVAAPEEGAAVPCERPRARVIREALAQDPFVPRTRSALSDGTGRFVIDGLDCGLCEADAGATFDLSVRPALQTGLAWWVRPGVQLDSDQLMQPLEMPTPVAQPIQLTYANPVSDDPDAPPVARALSGALVRVFALLDNDSKVVGDTEGLEWCVTIPDPDGSRCIQSLVQLAEVRSGTEGEFLLLLPPRIE